MAEPTPFGILADDLTGACACGGQFSARGVRMRLLTIHDPAPRQPEPLGNRGEGVLVDGPVPPDSLYLRAFRGGWDGVVAMYHDQGHIPQKLIAFEDAVNVTPGLPIIRTAVDHGTAIDIAGKGLADPTNMVKAIDYAIRTAAGKAAP